MKLTFTVYEIPKPQPRPRARIIKTNGKSRAVLYDPGDAKEYKKLIREVAAMAAVAQNWDFQEDAPLLLNCTFYMPIYKSWSDIKKEEASRGLISPTGKPDVDNLIKAVQDALNGLCYKDDSQIICSSGVKKYAFKPCVEVSLEVVL